MAAALPSPTMPAGFTPPLTVDNSINHNGLIAVLTAFSMFLVLGSLGIRVYSAYNRRARQLDDDWCFGLTVVFALAQTCVVSASIHLGWGKTDALITAKSPMDKTVYCADLLYVSVMVCSKASTAIFYRTVTLRSFQWMTYALLAVIVLWGPAAVIMLAVRCTSSPWDNVDKKCDILFARWQTITAIDIVLEAALILYPVQAIPRLQTSLSKKVVVVLILSCRVVLIPVSAVHLYYMNRQIQSSDPSLEGTIATVVAEIHVALSVMVLITPLMKPFIAAYVDENGLAYTDEASNSRSSHSSRSRTMKGVFKPRDPYASTEEEPLSYQQALAAENRIMKSVQISVAREALELSERGKRRH
ncbi:uncharacterized protein N7459_002403 [Penicillium hispanicum]|uniref:uncharacterized protein n=1 Tax=Penicillium hispanicum TaxID=1080232 RepID=UPI0025404F31|nr:uncharacterized protein N7459_002403 [Penicillium hispanicum]KAJ5592034.1 hypothetical protein N7459_002403 [Penicillium hispanicum]